MEVIPPFKKQNVLKRVNMKLITSLEVKPNTEECSKRYSLSCAYHKKSKKRKKGYFEHNTLLIVNREKFQFFENKNQPPKMSSSRRMLITLKETKDQTTYDLTPKATQKLKPFSNFKP